MNDRELRRRWFYTSNATTALYWVNERGDGYRRDLLGPRNGPEYFHNRFVKEKLHSGEWSPVSVLTNEQLRDQLRSQAGLSAYARTKFQRWIAKELGCPKEALADGELDWLWDIIDVLARETYRQGQEDGT